MIISIHYLKLYPIATASFSKAVQHTEFFTIKAEEFRQHSILEKAKCFGITKGDANVDQERETAETSIAHKVVPHPHPYNQSEDHEMLSVDRRL